MQLVLAVSQRTEHPIRIAKIATTAKNHRNFRGSLPFNFGNYQFWQYWQSRYYSGPSLRFGVLEKSRAAPHQGPITFWPSIAEKLPGVAHLCNHIEVEIGHHDFVLVAAGLSDDLAARRAEIALAVKL